MPLKPRLKRFKAAFRVLGGKKKKKEARKQAAKAKSILKKAKQEAKKKTLKERLLGLSRRISGKEKAA